MGFLDAFKAVMGVANRLLGRWFVATLVQPSSPGLSRSSTFFLAAVTTQMRGTTPA
jgi:hypothetical protein